VIARTILASIGAVFLTVAGILAWMNAAGLLIVGALLVFVLLAVIRDLRAGRRVEAETKNLPAEETQEGFKPDAFGVRMGRIEDRTRRITRDFGPPSERW